MLFDTILKIDSILLRPFCHTPTMVKKRYKANILRACPSTSAVFITARAIYDLAKKGRELIDIVTVQPLQDPHYTVLLENPGSLYPRSPSEKYTRTPDPAEWGGKRTNLFTQMNTWGSPDDIGMADFFLLSLSTASYCTISDFGKTVNCAEFLALQWS